MRTGDLTYRAFSYLKHLLTSWNTGGEGIHSPNLFYIVRMLLYDENQYYAWADIEARREAMLRAPKRICVDDYGTGISGERQVGDIARTSLCQVKEGRLWFRLAQYLACPKNNPDNEKVTIVELGTSLGISTAYLALANMSSRVYTFEGSHEIAELARFNWKKLGAENITCVEGNIDDTLPDFLYHTLPSLSNRAPACVGLALIDANHTYDATLRYFDLLLPFMGEQSVLVVDDIRYSKEMGRAWDDIKNHERVTTTMDLYDCGLAFFDSHFLKKHYHLRW